MITGGVGGANTKTGLAYEGKVDLKTFLSQQSGYRVDGSIVFYHDEEVAQIFKKHELYSQFLSPRGIDWKKCISSQLLPDNGIYVIINNTVFIIEVKTQNTTGSVDEKLQTCDFKKKQYQKLFFPLNIEVQFTYILDDWFRQPKYKDVLDYIISVGCQYYFQYIPLQKLGLPVPPTA
ncbi:hypothetical protein [Muribaculum intestinale]|uniref:hypothetical protein n=1 Tax=Muribaculum intestinale TaxID=1796646 RepID=UPI000F47E65A|nr:hypothetical protein [Muribaculum intestinale]ROT05684.1 hypothetical protein EEL42_09510 [Muribaculaceae bacterium Isolate-100 (HZI)]RXE63635.1 hypothetical protein ED388_14735 [Muribaculaceae bacterium Isolate-007 (NCI)]